MRSKTQVLHLFAILLNIISLELGTSILANLIKF